MQIVTVDDANKILQHSAEDIDRIAQDVARACRALAKTQIRNFYGPIVRLRSDLARPRNRQLPSRYSRDLFMHAARLAYMAARDKKAEPLERCFAQLVRMAIKNNTIGDEQLRAICDFSEAIVAYHYSLQGGTP